MVGEAGSDVCESGYGGVCIDDVGSLMGNDAFVFASPGETEDGARKF